MSSNQESATAAPISGKDKSIGDPGPNQADKRVREKPVIYVFDKSHWPTVFRQMHQPLLDALELVATIKFAINGDEARRALALEPHAVLLAHPECVPDSGEQMNATFFDYMCGGGIVILMGHCVVESKFRHLMRFFQGLEVEWVLLEGTWSFRDNVLNGTPETLKYNYLKKEMEGIDADYVLVRNKNDAWYKAKNTGDTINALVAFRRVGDGRLGFIGDKFSKPATDVAVLAMCGLLGLAKPDPFEWGDEDRTYMTRASGS